MFSSQTKTTSFSSTFHDCTSLGGIGAGLFDNCTGVTSFLNLFYRCTNLSGSIPTDLFRYNPDVTTFGSTFYGCTSLSGTIPEDLFYYNSAVTSYNGTFRGVGNLQLPTRLFNLSNLSVVTNFSYLYYHSTSSQSNIGTTQDIWNYTTGATITNAFINNSSLDNWLDIPAAWGGGGA